MSWEAWGDGDDGFDPEPLLEAGWLSPDDATEMAAAVEGMRTAFRQIKTWVALHKAGELSISATLEQIERDADRCLPATVSCESR